MVRDPGLVGSEILINGHPFTIVGIMPAGFTGTMHLAGPELWLPLSVHEDVMNDFQRSEAPAPLNRARRFATVPRRPAKARRDAAIR
jgi:hypothetical protein